MPDIQRIKLLKGTLNELLQLNAVLLEGEICLISSNNNNGYDSLVIGDGVTEAKLLKPIPLNVSQGSVFLGVANTETDPGIPQSGVFYIAMEPGKYTNFGNIQVMPGEVCIFSYRYESWNKISILTIDSELSDTSINPVQNKIVTTKLKELEGKIIHTVKVNNEEVQKENGIINLTVDSELSNTSDNPIKNRAVTEKFKEYDQYGEEMSKTISAALSRFQTILEENETSTSKAVNDLIDKMQNMEVENAAEHNRIIEMHQNVILDVDLSIDENGNLIITY